MRKTRIITAILIVLGLITPNLWATGDPNLIAHWTFDESEDDIAYDSAGNNDGTVYGVFPGQPMAKSMVP